MNNTLEIENLFSNLLLHIKNRSLSDDAVKQQFLKVLNQLDQNFSDHLSRLAPLLKDRLTQADKDFLIIKAKALLIVKILRLENQLGIMANENVITAIKNQPPKYTDEEMDKVRKESDVLKQAQTSDTKALEMVIKETEKIKSFAEKYYRSPKRKIDKVKCWFKYSNLVIFFAKAILFFAAILLAHCFSPYLEPYFGDGLLLEIVVAVIFVVSVDKIFDALKEWLFWKRYDLVHKQFYTAHIKFQEAEAAFLEHVKLAK
jgi:hypothetical protein